MPTYKYLDDNGLTYYNGKIQAKLDNKLSTDGTAYRTTSIPYGECDSTSTSTVYTATIPGITELRDGVCMWLKNGVVTSAANFTININGLGAKPVYSNLAAASRESTLWNVAYTMLFVYDSDRVAGGCWVLYRGYDSNTNTIGYQLRTNSSTLPAKEKGYRYRLWLTSADGQGYVPINTATGTATTDTKALNTDTPIDPFGAIVYNSTNGTVNANASLPTGTQWSQYTLDIRYQKYPLTLTYPDPVYLQCTPQSTGGALINDIVQALPTTEDGKIYIYLGNAYSATSMELKQNHPVYYYKDGAIRQWTNSSSSAQSDLFIVAVSNIDTTQGTFTADKTYEQILTAFNSGKIPILEVAIPSVYGTGTVVATLYNAYADGEYDSISFIASRPGASSTSGGSPSFIANSVISFDFVKDLTGSTPVYTNYYRNSSAGIDVVQSIDSSSTDSQVPTAKCMYTAIGDVESILTTLNNGGGAQ